jgi:hypothetical protein
MENTGTEKLQKTTGKYDHIPGWGIDADPENEPTYPYKTYTGDDHNRLNYKRPVQQEINIEKLHSNERPSVSAVFGTTCPPSGVSGMLRRYAFTFSEGQWRHWLTLILADRVNVVEGIVEDISKGIVPNIFAEKGWQAEWKYNRKGFIQSLAITAAVVAGITLLLANRKRLSRG